MEQDERRRGGGRRLSVTEKPQETVHGLHCCPRPNARCSGGRTGRFARTVGLRQDDDVAYDRRPRCGDQRAGHCRRQGHHGRAALLARHGRRIPELRIIPAYDCCQKCRIRPRNARRPRRSLSRRVKEAIGLVRLPDGAARPRELSGGQQQRVALARRLVIQPSILLFDEPLSNLDAKLRDEMRTEIRDIQQRLGITAVFVTHDQAEALAMCDKVAVMNAGRLEQLGTPLDLYERPANPFVASFVGRINRVPGVASGTIGSKSDKVKYDCQSQHRRRSRGHGPPAPHRDRGARTPRQSRA